MSPEAPAPSEDCPSRHRDTELQHLGEDRASYEGAAAPPVYRTSLFTFPESEQMARYFRGERERHLYSRDSNPTVRILEEKVAALEHTESAIALASGMGAISAVLLSQLRAGDRLALFGRSYGPTLTFARDVLQRWNIEVQLLSPEDVSRLDDVLDERTKLIYVESPASLTMDVLDLRKISSIARARGITTATDNSWASPIFQNPALVGIDIVIHSGTKYIAGHSDILLGLIATSAKIANEIRTMATLLGASLSPDDASLAIRGLRTLPIRMKRHEESGLIIANRLDAHPGVREVLHPALPGFPGHASWREQFSGSSGLFSFRFDGDSCELCDRLKIFLLGVSWGGFESLAFPLGVAQVSRPGEGVRPDVDSRLVRLSIGLEDPEDLWADLEQALAG